MPDQRIDQLNAETTPAAVDVLPVFSIAGADTKKITVKNLIQVGATLVDDASIPLAKVNLGGLNIVNASIDASAAIAYSKLATLTSGNIVLGSSGNVATSTPITGDVTISNTGVTAIATGIIVDADINASAAIADTKLGTIATGGKVSNSATTAASANTASAIVARDASGNFTAGTITAALTGTASGNLVAGGALGTPSSGTLTSCTGLPISTGVSGLGTGAATFLATPSSANFASLLTDETGSGAAVFATSPTLVSPALGTPVSGVLTNCTNLPVATASVVGAVSIPADGGFALTGGGALSHSNSVAGGASTRSGITFDLQGHIVSTAALVAADLPVATNAVKGAVIAGGGLAIDGNGIVSTAVATTSDLGGIKIGSEFGLNGSNQLLLAVQANVAGGSAYPKVTVNSKGVVTAGASLTSADIPVLDTSKITSGTLAIDRYGANTITGAKLANYATGKISEAFPTADYISQLFFNPLEKTLYMWDGNVYQPIGVSFGQVVFSGTYDASTNLITSVTVEGAAIGLTVGGALVSPVAATKAHYVVVDQPGTGTAPAPTIALSPPDMLLSNGSSYILLDVSDTVTAQLASNIQVSPAGNIASTNVQSALQELDDEKLPLAGGTLTGNLALNTGIAIVYEGSTTNNFETTLFVVDPTADRTILLPNVSGTVVTTGDSGTVTSAMLLNGTILNEDINASAAIVDTKLDTIATALKVSNSATTAASANTASAIVARDASGNFTAGTITAALTGNASSATTAAACTGNAATVTTNANLTGDVTSTGNATAIAAGVIVNADINASAAIVDTKLATIATAGKVSNSATTATNANTASAIVARDASGNFTAGTITAALTGAASSNVLKAGDTMTGALVVPLASASTPSLTFTGDLNTGIFSPGADQVAVSTGGTGRLFVNSTGLGVGIAPGRSIDVYKGDVGQAILRLSDADSRNVEFRSPDGTGAQGSIGTVTNHDFIGFTSNTERARIDSSGRLLVGTATGKGKLSILQPNTSTIGDGANSGISIVSVGGNAVGRINSIDFMAGFNIDTATTSIGYICTDASGYGKGDIFFATRDTTTDVGATERMRIDNTGGLYIGPAGDYANSNYSQTTGNGSFYYRRDNGSEAGSIIASNNADRGWALAYLNKFAWDSGDDSRWIVFYLNGVSQDSISWTGSAISYGTSSDYRRKTNPSTYAGGLEKVKQLHVREYEWVEFPEAGKTVGFFAHELQEIFPQAVTGVKDGMKIDEFSGEEVPSYQGIDYGKITPLLAAALQEAIAKIESLEARLTAAGL